ncbi:DinB family protein [Virgibacillus halodenitrificans]|uniref:DinB family protein n=1 Tax=Virgibacillus halodenitrificans TaxID=1482 RepID=UPI00030A9E6C|nr:DinB family protein [Virgibacillus halodenitrificans]
MCTTNNLINDFEGFNSYVSSLKKIDETLFFEPIADGKWSIAEIISHISFWDRYIHEETLPQMKSNAVIESIDFEPLNGQAEKYALSGVSQLHLLQQKLEERSLLATDLRKKDENEFFEKFILNGEEIDKYSGYPHTIFNYIAGFQWHDNHHRQQIDVFLKDKEV